MICQMQFAAQGLQCFPMIPAKCYEIIGQESDFVNLQQDLQVMITNDSSWKEHIVMISYFHNYKISTTIWQKVKF